MEVIEWKMPSTLTGSSETTEVPAAALPQGLAHGTCAWSEPAFANDDEVRLAGQQGRPIQLRRADLLTGRGWRALGRRFLSGPWAG